MSKIDNSDSESSTEKKIYPVYNENNFYITKEIINIILSSINDWPTSIISIEEFVIDIEKFIKTSLRYLALES